MNPKIKQALQIGISLGVAAFLIGYIFTIVDFSAMVSELQNANYYWIAASIAISLVAHAARGLRWNLLLDPLNFKAKPANAVKAVLVGYLANYALPRAGELARCSLVKKTDDIPVNVSLGTVITERVVDVVAMALVFGLSFLLEFNRLKDFVSGFFGAKFQSLSESALKYYWLFAIVALGILMIIYLLYKNREKLLKIGIIAKIYGFAEGLLSGLMSITRMKSSGLFIFYTFVIWFCYYAMTQVIFYSMADTATLPIQAGLVVLALASLGMAAPVQGGIGAYHFMVATGLLIYGIPQEKGLILATILHTSQFLTILLFGGVSLISSLLVNSKKQEIEHSR